MKNIEYFAEVVGQIENSGKTTGENIPEAGKGKTSAKGLYQFTDDSVVTAINRLKKYIGLQDWMKDAKKHKDANKLTREQQTLLFMGNMLEAKGSDKWMKEVLQGDKDSMVEAYREIHHTNTKDKKIEKRARSFFK